MTPTVENALPPAPAAGGAGDAPGDPAEAAAWAEVVAAWTDEARHRAYLERFRDLEGLASAGGRYRAALAERPDDPIAARFRDEVLRRAVAAGLASLPRAAPEHGRARLAVRIAAGAVIGGLLLAAVLLAARLVPLVAGGAPP